MHGLAFEILVVASLALIIMTGVALETACVFCFQDKISSCISDMMSCFGNRSHLPSARLTAKRNNVVTTRNNRRNVFIRGLRKQHSIEREAVQLLEHQVVQLENYPDVVRRMKLHICETKAQIQRLECILRAYESDYSSIKNTGFALIGNLTALGHTFAEDKVIENSFANLAFENFEIAAYRALVSLAELCGDTVACDALKQSLEEERAMAAFVEKQIAPTIRTYIARLDQKEQASH